MACRLALGIGMAFFLSPPVLAGGGEEGPAEEKEKPAGQEEPGPGDESEAGDPEPKATTKAPRKEAGSRALSVDEQYVQANLQNHLQPTKMSFLPDGRVQMTFDFSLKSADHVPVFDPPIQSSLQGTLRWTVQREEVRYGAYGDADFRSGLRLSDAGATHLKCWFKDDVEAEMTFVNSTSFSPANVAAVVFSNAKGEAIGSNFGTQASTFSKGKQMKRKGDPEKLNIYTSTRIKLVVRDETFESHSRGVKKESLPYSRKNFSSGRIGILWGGKIAGMAPSLTITGRLDVEKMVKELKKKPKP